MNQLHHFSFLQSNLNHCAAAQDLLLQSMAEWDIDLAVASEPYFVPPQARWVGDLDGSVAVLTGCNNGPSLMVLERGSGYAMAKWGEYVVIGIYFSPNRSLAEFETYLDTVSEATNRQTAGQVIVLGDFNAKSQAWGNPATNSRGRAVQIWALLQDLSLLNRGTAYTCVRQQGGSVVDLSFATPAVARRVVNWRVEEEVETLSDHNYIRFEIVSPQGLTAPSRSPSSFPRWCLSLLDRELAKEAAIVQRWSLSGSNIANTADAGVEDLANRLGNALKEVCDASMPRARRRPPRRRVYWWSPEIANLRAICNRARRLYVRCRRRNGLDPDLENELRSAYRQAKKALQLAIFRAKESARKELLEGLNRDPWGRPYHLARNKLSTQGAPVTETMQPDLLARLVGELFPDPQGCVPPAMSSPPGRDDVVDIPLITAGELNLALDRVRVKKTAPGPDGIPGKVIYIAMKYLGDRFRELFDSCLLTGQFPKSWKDGKLCLLRKEGRPLDSPSGYRPIVLLSETGKIFEKVLATRLNEHLETIGPGLSEAQYGFRTGRSTLDALDSLKGMTLEAVDSGDVVLAVSLDVANAFNSLPFATLLEALRYHGVPPYLRRLLGSYLQDREVIWEGRNGQIFRRRVCSGVPQGSVLGPVLWNIGFDWILRAPLLPGMRVLCYADDTLVTARGRTYEEAARLAAVGASLVVDRIRMLGLRVAISKTEALLFHGPRRGPPRGAQIVVQGTQVKVKTHLKYLGLILDGRWSFKAHFEQLAPRLVNAAAALGRLLPNIGGPDSTCRQLYAGIVRSMALYGAPIWIHAMTPQNKILLRRPQRVIAIRLIRGYRTVSWTAATLLAGDPPWELQAEVLAEVYRYRAGMRARGEQPEADEMTRLRVLASAVLVRRWGEDLEFPVAGIWTVEAIRPHLERWLKRKHGTLSYRLVQVLTGHGCFGKYLHEIVKREETPACQECGAAEDTAYHTLVECAAWGPQRYILSGILGGNFMLPGIVSTMIGSEVCWTTMASFCESVIALKEAAERERELDVNAHPLRRRRQGGRRRRYAHLLPPM